MVYIINESNPVWDGTNYKNGTDCSEGTYYYVLNLVNFEGSSMRQQGWVELIRK